MENEITKQSNRIAEFKGYEYIPYDPDSVFKPGWWMKNTPKNYGKKGSASTKFSNLYFLCRRHGELRYYNEWNWLMPVVEKIESIYDDYHGYFAVYISSNSCSIQGTKLTPEKADVYYSQFYRDTKREATFLAVVNFIDWYDANLKNK